MDVHTLCILSGSAGCGGPLELGGPWCEPGGGPWLCIPGGGGPRLP